MNTSKMKVIVWHESYLAGGADWSLIDLVTAWPDRQASFTIYINETHEGVKLVRDRLKGRATVETFESPFEFADRFKKPRALRMAAWVFGILRCGIQYRRRFRKIDCDLFLYNNGGYPGGLSNYVIAWVLRRKPIAKRVMIVRNYPARSYRQSALMKVTRYLCHRTLDRMVAVSHSLRKSLIESGGIDATLVDTIHNGISLENKMASGAKSLAVGNDHLKAGIIGTLEARKGHRILLQAWQRVHERFPTAELWIVGSRTSGNRAQLMEFADRLGISDSLRWKDFTHDIGEIYLDLDVVIMPSQESESFGRVVVESMAFGKPIIGANIGGIPEIIASGEDGILIEPQDSETLAERICDLFSSDTLRTTMGERGKQKYQTQFSAQRMAEKYHELISAL